MMRGVQVPAWVRTVEFTCDRTMVGFWIMAGCVAVGLGILCFQAVAERQA